ncbi:MAG TPA: TolC family protein [Bryobacteraceae bacterium]|nr:TolC family protein [Bryobacteraceae bacterium]HOQ47803.1 TolC family protein [Bryobacteraceae bacterium]HPQ15691.1 TolC family protein [Bryobacteraceae bacterium]HPU73779.1 TolC family protein [Bryobacteraceae bacterium]
MHTRPFISVLIVAAAFAAEETPHEFTRAEPFAERARQRGPVIELSLKAALEQAIERNLDVKVQRFTVETNRVRLHGAKGVFDPQLSFSAGLNRDSSPATSLLQTGTGLSAYKSRSATFAPGIQQFLPGGGTAGISISGFRNSTNDAYTFVNPIYGSGLTLTLTQPLLRGFRWNAAENQIRLLRLESKVGEAQFRQVLAEVVHRVRNAYWALVGAVEGYEARRQSQELAIRQYENTRQRVENGMLTPVALTSSRAEVALRDQEILEAEVQIINAQNVLKQLIAPGPNDPIWNAIILPTDRPQARDIHVTLDEAVRTALENRPELEQLRLQLRQSRLNRKYYAQETKPAVNLQGTIGSVGRAGTVYLPQADLDPGSSRVLNPTHPGFGGLSTSFQQVMGFDFLNWSAGIQVQLPIGNRAAQARYAEAVLAERRLETQMKQGEVAILVEVRNAYEAIVTRKKSLEVSRLASQLSLEQLEGETARFEAGFSTNFEVLRYQRDYAEARIRELNALINYENAITALQRAMNTIIEESGIVIEASGGSQ